MRQCGKNGLAALKTEDRMAYEKKFREPRNMFLLNKSRATYTYNFETYYHKIKNTGLLVINI